MSNRNVSASRAQDLCVLLLEDDDADAYLTGRALVSLPRVGQVIRARDGREAMAKLQSGSISPDIAFIDLHMPVMNGLDFLGTCVDQGLRNIPLIVLTSSSDWKDALRSRVQGALWVITKPEDPADLKRSLQEAIDAFTPDDSARSSDYWPAAAGAESLPYTPPTASKLAPAAVAQFGRRPPRPGS